MMRGLHRRRSRVRLVPIVSAGLVAVLTLGLPPASAGDLTDEPVPVESSDLGGTTSEEEAVASPQPSPEPESSPTPEPTEQAVPSPAPPVDAAPATPTVAAPAPVAPGPAAAPETDDPTQAPQVTIRWIPAEPNHRHWYTRIVDAHISAADPDDVEWIRYRVDDGPIQETTGTGFSVEFTTDGVHRVRAWASDSLGNVSAPVDAMVWIDRSEPEVASEGALAEGRVARGSSAPAAFTCADPHSDVDLCVLRFADGTELSPGDPLPTATSGELTYTITAVNGAGLVETRPGILVVADEDTEPPVLVVTTEPAASNARGWFRRDVMVTITASDPGSGVAWVEYRVAQGPWNRVHGNEALVPVTTDGIVMITYRGADTAGNVTGERTRQINLDRVEPVVEIDPSIDGARVERGAELVADFSCSDAHSGILSCVGSTPPGVTLPTDTEGTFELSVTGVDRAGNFTERRAEYTVEAPPAPVPAATAAPSTPPNQHEWWNDDVEVTIAPVPGTGAASVHWELEGAQSGHGSSPDATTVTISAEGDTRVDYWAEDAEGGASEPVRLDVSIDRTAPLIRYAGLVPEVPFAGSAADAEPDLVLELGEQRTVTVACDDDDGSGVDECDSPLLGGALLPTDRAGDFTIRSRAVDLAGNETVDDMTYRVVDPAQPGEEPVEGPGETPSRAPVPAGPPSGGSAGDRPVVATVRSGIETGAHLPGTGPPRATSWAALALLAALTGGLLLTARRAR